MQVLQQCPSITASRTQSLHHTGSLIKSKAEQSFVVKYFISFCIFFFFFYLHGVNCDGEGRVVPVHLVLLAALLVSHGALVCSSDAEHAQDYHEHQEAHTHHNDNGGSAGNHCRENSPDQKAAGGN